MPIKPYIPASPPLKPAYIGVPTRRISALIIEEDLSDVDSSDSSWFLPSKLYETVTISQKAIPEFLVKQSNVTTAADTSRRPSITLARLQTQGLEDVDIKLPNYDHPFSQGFLNDDKKSRRGSNTSEVLFRSPLRKCRTYSDYGSDSERHSVSSPSSRSSSSHSPLNSDLGDEGGYESPVFHLDSDCDCDCACVDKDDGEGMEDECAVKEGDISGSASSLPIEFPKRKTNLASRRRRGCFVEEDALESDKMSDGESVEDWIQFAFAPSTSFETALISEVIRRRKSDEHFSRLKNSPGSEKELENAQFSESHRRSKWIKDMVRYFPQECGGGHMLPSF